MKETEIGKTIVIGINFFSSEDQLIEQYQTSGVIDKITRMKICIKREDGLNVFTLPNDDRAMKIAEPGDYRERSTGKVISNPDYIAQWAVNGINESENLDIYKEIGFNINEENCE